jgi:hypothetical protein
MDGNPAFYSHTVPGHEAGLMRCFVHHPPLGRQQILIPSLLNMDESALPFAEKEMLQRRNLNKIIFGVQLQFFLQEDPGTRVRAHFDAVITKRASGLRSVTQPPNRDKFKELVSRRIAQD